MKKLFTIILSTFVSGLRKLVLSALLAISLFSCMKDEIVRIPIVRNTTVENIAVANATAISELVDGGEGATQYGHCWGTEKEPGADQSKTMLGTPENRGKYTSQLSNLLPGTTYYVRPYVLNNNKYYYGDETSFITLGAEMAQISTGSVVSVTDSSAILMGKITSIGAVGDTIVRYGYCWSLNPKPDTSDSYLVEGKAYDTIQFLSTLLNLEPYKLYYIRAFAENRAGISYGQELKCHTKYGTPVLQTSIVAGSVSNQGVELYGKTTDFGGQTFERWGFVVDTIPNATLNYENQSSAISSSSSTKFRRNIWYLIGDKTYYARAFAQTATGTYYGNEVRFKTLHATLPDAEIDVFSRRNFEMTLDLSFVSSLNNGAIIYSSGVYLSTSPDPETTGTIHYASTEYHDFTPIECIPQTTYYVKGFHNTNIGQALSREHVFHLSEKPIPLHAIAPIEFEMGKKYGTENQTPAHNVQLSNFMIGIYETTVANYCEFLNDFGVDPEGYYQGVQFIDVSANPNISFTGEAFTHNSNSSNLPITYVSWYGAKAYCEWAGGRLPTEAEWEYVATMENQWLEYNFDKVCWYSENSQNTLHEVGTTEMPYKDPDMNGNAREWCQDWYDPDYYQVSESENPQGPIDGTMKSIRGGSYQSSASECASRARDYASPELCLPDVGFRIAVAFD